MLRNLRESVLEKSTIVIKLDLYHWMRRFDRNTNLHTSAIGRSLRGAILRHLFNGSKRIDNLDRLQKDMEELRKSPEARAVANAVGEVLFNETWNRQMSHLKCLVDPAMDPPIAVPARGTCESANGMLNRTCRTGGACSPETMICSLSVFWAHYLMKNKQKRGEASPFGVTDPCGARRPRGSFQQVG